MENGKTDLGHVPADEVAQWLRDAALTALRANGGHVAPASARRDFRKIEGLGELSHQGADGFRGYNGVDPVTGVPLCEHNDDADGCTRRHSYPRKVALAGMEATFTMLASDGSTFEVTVTRKVAG